MIANDLTARLLERTLDASSLRQRVLSHNIANVNTPGFKRARVEFEERLAQAVSANQDLDGVQPAVVEETHSIGRPDGNNVDIELEMAQLAENQIWYSTLTRQLSDHFSRLRMVITDGRR